MGSTFPSELCLAIDGRIAWSEVRQVCWLCGLIGSYLAYIGLSHDRCTLQGYEQLRK